MRLIIREATKEEAKWILHHRVEMNRAMGAEEEYIEKSIEVAKPFLENDWTKHFHYYLVEKNGEIIGGCGLSVFRIIPFASNPTGLMAYLFNMFVKPEHCRKGVGRTLMNHIYEICKKEGIYYIGLHASPMSHPLYDSEGFFVSNAFMQILPLEKQLSSSS